MTDEHPTGPQHYAWAEQHLVYASEADAGSNGEGYHLLRAEVHAKLAQASATVLAALVSSGMVDPERQAEVIVKWEDFL